METVPCYPGATVSATAPVAHQCPVKKERDEGVLTVQWSTSSGKTLELHSLASHLRSLEGEVVTHEDLCRNVFRAVAAAGVKPVSVSYETTTAGLEVSVDVVLRESL